MFFILFFLCCNAQISSKWDRRMKLSSMLRVNKEVKSFHTRGALITVREVIAWISWPYSTPKCDCSLCKIKSWHCTEGAERREQGYGEDTVPNRDNSMGVTFQETVGQLLRECFYSTASQSYLSALLLWDITRTNISCQGMQGKLPHFLRFVGNVWSTCLLILSRILLFHLESGFPDARNFSQKVTL